MRKMVATIATGIFIIGSGATTVAADKYEVEKKDTLWSIAQDHDTTVEELIELNKLEDTIIHPKQTIYLSEKSKTEKYKVKKGDTLDKIAKKYKTNTTSIKKWNDLNSDLIVVGSTLKIKRGEKVSEDSEIKEVKENGKKIISKGTNKSSQNNKTKKIQRVNKNVEENKQAPKVIAKKKEEPKKIEKEQQKIEKEQQLGKEITVEATAYTANCKGCSGITATGINLKNDRNAKVIAVDPNVIPLGSKVHVPGYGTAIAADTGGSIKGNRIDIHVPDNATARNWGRKNVNVTILD